MTAEDTTTSLMAKEEQSGRVICNLSSYYYRGGVWVPFVHSIPVVEMSSE